jgi:hypothetical protein
VIIEVALIHHVKGKLADVALRFEAGEPLAGFVLGGFQIWTPRDESRFGEISVTLPARTWNLPNGGTGQYVILRDSRIDKQLDPPETVALKAEIVAAYNALAQRGSRLRDVAAARLAGPASPAPRGVPRGPLRARVAQPLGTIVHRVAPAHAEA